MRIFIIIFLLVVATAAVFPFIVGSKVETQLRQRVAEFDGLPVYMLEVKSYEKGYLSSEAVVSLGFDQAALDGLIEEMEVPSEDSVKEALESFDIHFDIQHGPVLTKHGFGLGWTDMQSSFDSETYPEYTEVFEALGHDLLLDWSMRLGLDGAGWMKTHVPDIDASVEEDGEEIQLVVSGFEGLTDFKEYGVSISSQGGVKEFSVNVDAEEGMEFSLKDMRLDAEFTYTDSILISLGTMEMGIESLRVTGDNLGFANMDGLVLHAVISEGISAETMSVRESIRMESADFNGYKVEDAEFAFAYVNIAKSVFETYMEATDFILSADSEEEINAELGKRFEPVLKEALTYDPKFELESVAFKSDDGSLKASGSIGIDSSLVGPDVDFENPYVLIPAVNILADVEMSESLVKTLLRQRVRSEMAAGLEDGSVDEEQVTQMVDMQIGMMAGPLEQQGYIERDGDNYSVVFSFENGAAAVNGVPIPIPGLF